MDVVSRTTCPHGLPLTTCEICRVLEPTAVPAARSARPDRRRGALPGNLAVVAIVALVGFVALGWVAAAFFVALRIIELVVVAGIAGWAGWKLGVRRGRKPG
jgi:small-conductance mechanosensitive channel